MQFVILDIGGIRIELKQTTIKIKENEHGKRILRGTAGPLQGEKKTMNKVQPRKHVETNTVNNIKYYLEEIKTDIEEKK